MGNLNKNDLIGIVSPSAPISAFCPRRLKRGIDFIESMGYRVALGENVSAIDVYTAGTAEQRAQDINRMLADENIKAIIITIGGYNANDVLDLIDYDLARRNKDKIVMGYSDSTVILHALKKKSDMRCLMGPMILPQFAEFPAMQEFTRKSFEFVTSNLGGGVVYDFPVAKIFTEEMLLWDKEDDRPRTMKPNGGWEVLSPGSAEGVLVPANLNTLCRLIGTEFMPDLAGAILFLEDDSDERGATIQRMLRQLGQAGHLKNIKGIVFGRFQEKSEVSHENLRFILKNIFGDLSFPVITNVNFGHTDPILTLPLGNSVIVDTQAKKISVIL